MKNARFAFLALTVVLTAAMSLPAQVSLTGAGATFPYPLYSRWFAEYHQAHPDVQINYQPIGSGGGIQQVRNKTVDFGASDAPLSDQQLKSLPPIVQLAMTAGPVCLTYNLPEISGKTLHLTPEVLSGIYLGHITKWNDGKITSINPGLNLPGAAILVVHRSDGSGTTNIFTTYLSAVSSEWESKVGHSTSVNWPVGIGGKGNDGVAGNVKNTHGAFGYVELAYALENHLPLAELKNKSGRYMTPTPEGVTAALKANAASLAKDVRNPIVNSSAPDAYPICGLTFLLVPKTIPDAARRHALKAFIGWALTTGQNDAGSLHYARLPVAVAKVDNGLLSQVH
jgi:phosphate transport system substrate-binding protein